MSKESSSSSSQSTVKDTLFEAAKTNKGKSPHQRKPIGPQSTTKHDDQNSTDKNNVKKTTHSNREVGKIINQTEEKSLKRAGFPIVNNRRNVDITVPTSSQRRNSADTTRKYAPFSELLDSVVFVLSGYQNPKRSQLRDKMAAMGANYKVDWDKTCTHLMYAN